MTLHFLASEAWHGCSYFCFSTHFSIQNNLCPGICPQITVFFSLSYTTIWLCVYQCNCMEVFRLLLDLDVFFVDLLRHSSRIVRVLNLKLLQLHCRAGPGTLRRNGLSSENILLDRTQGYVCPFSLCCKDMELWIISFFVQSQYFSNVSILADPYKKRLSGTCNIVFQL